MRITNKETAMMDAVKAVRKANREMEYSLLGSGWHAKTHTTKNKKKYTRKEKHKDIYA